MMQHRCTEATESGSFIQQDHLHVSQIGVQEYAEAVWLHRSDLPLLKRSPAEEDIVMDQAGN